MSTLNFRWCTSCRPFYRTFGSGDEYLVNLLVEYGSTKNKIKIVTLKTVWILRIKILQCMHISSKKNRKREFSNGNKSK